MPTAYRFGPYLLDAHKRRLYRGDEPLSLTPKALELLLVLVERPHQLVEKDELMARLWPDTIVEEANLSQHVFTLRKVLGERAGTERFIATVPRRGFRFLAEVEVLGGPVAGTNQAEAPAALRRFTIALPPGAPAARLPVPVLAISPDERDLVYAGRNGATTALFRRPMASLDVHRIPGTEGATTPFWSPDSAWLGFAANGRLWRMRREGGSAHSVAEAPECRGATWTEDGRIVFAPGPAEGLWIVPATGGRAEALTTVDFANGERTHRWPARGPTPRSVLFAVGSAGIASFDEASVWTLTLDSGERRLVLDRATDPRALDERVAVFVREGIVMAAVVGGDVSGVPRTVVPALEGVAVETTGLAHLTVGGSGAVIHASGERALVRRELRWGSPDAMSVVPGTPLAEIEEPRISPDGRSVALGMRDGTSDIWILDLVRGVLGRVTGLHDNFAPVWTPDGEFLTFSSNQRGPTNIYRRRADGAGDVEPLVISDYDLVPSSWAQDGGRLLFTEYHPETGADIWCLDRPNAAPSPLLCTRFNEWAAMWSPTGDAFLFTSDESGIPQVYVRSFPDGPRVQVSIDGGSEGLWSRDGRRVFFRHGRQLRQVEVHHTERRWHVGRPVVYADDGGEAGTPTGLPNYDIAADGRLLIVAGRRDAPDATTLVVTLGWADHVRSLLADPRIR